ncbi:MAG: phospholipase D-like domain-containing protein [Candidatus Dormibacteraceae bacterium]
MLAPPPIQFVFLEDGAQSAEGVVQRLAEFIDGATRTLEMAVYDLRLQGTAAAGLLAAVRGAAARGVAVRLVFNQDHPRKRPVPPPAGVDWDLIHQFGIPFEPVSGEPDLMHHKYVVRDAELPAAAVWTGSTNWTTDSWTREENVIVRVLSQPLAASYRQDFEDLWATRDVSKSGKFTAPWVELDGVRVRPFFSPGRGEKMSHTIAQAIAAARRRVLIASPVLTSGPILGTIAEVVHAGQVDLRGIYDRTQMAEVQRQWSAGATVSWKLEAFRAVAASGRFSSKVTVPYSPGSVHDFMHAKMTVADDTVFVGSYNLSHSGEMNAENVLQVEGAAVAELCAAYLERIIARYRSAAA